MSEFGQQIITIHILTNIWRSKDNHTMIFDQLIKYNMKKKFSWKVYTKHDGETSPRVFLWKNQNWTYFWTNSLKCYKIYFYVKVEIYQIILKHIKNIWRSWPLAFTLYKTFVKNKRSGTSLPNSFFAWVFKKNISHIFY